MRSAAGFRGTAVLTAAVFVAGIAAGVATAATDTAPVADASPTIVAVGELQTFTDWLERNDVEGWIGEVGWPDDQPEWEPVAEAWFDAADAAGLPVTVWATGSWWGDDPRAVYDAGDPTVGVDRTSGQSGIVESHLDRGGGMRGVSVAGAEFGAPADEATSDFSAANPGVAGRDYQYDPPATFSYLASRGIEVIRLPFRWERLQRHPGAPLDADELARLGATVDAAGAAGLRVVLDLHNYGAFYGADGVRHPVGSAAVPVDALVDLWRRLSDEFHGHPAVLAYGLMNEPVGLPGADERQQAELWERTSQAVVDALRAGGDDTLALVCGYGWSGVTVFDRLHPDAWIDDPADNVRYEAHHYWDADGSGSYGGPTAP